MPDLPSAVPPDEHTTALRLMTLPRDTNQYGTVFGGVILSSIDQAGFIEARKHGLHRWVTAAIDRVDFVAPVHVGDVVSFRTRTVSTGTSSVRVDVLVEAERFTSGDIVKVTSATITMVAVNAAGRPIPFNSPPSVSVSEFGEPAMSSAAARRRGAAKPRAAGRRTPDR